jgi:hypothetical protein
MTTATEFDITLKELRKAMRQNPGRRTLMIRGQRITNLCPFDQRFWFEYHCWESDQSADAALWHRSHQRVTVVGLDHCDVVAATTEERIEACCLLHYLVRFADGKVFTAAEDELYVSKKNFCRPDPPEDPKSSF